MDITLRWTVSFLERADYFTSHWKEKQLEKLSTASIMWMKDYIQKLI